MRVFIVLENGENNEIFLPYDNSTEKKITTFKYTLVARLVSKYYRRDYKRVLNDIWRGKQDYNKYKKILSNEEEEEGRPQIFIDERNENIRHKGEKVDKYLERVFK